MQGRTGGVVVADAVWRDGGHALLFPLLYEACKGVQSTINDHKSKQKYEYNVIAISAEGPRDPLGPIATSFISHDSR